MKIESFKELLLKKVDDANLATLIKYAKDDFLIDHIIESLEKMAISNQHKNTNSAVKHFGMEMDPEIHPNMIHDALSHHASQYKAALKAKNQDLANQHARQIFKYMHMGHKVTKDGMMDHSGGKLKIEAIDPKPWERSGYSAQNSNGKFTTDTKGWSRDSSDYSWLKGKPHQAYKNEVSRHGHNGAYPLENIKVNGKHIVIDDNAKADKFEDHPMDKHPIMGHYKTPAKNMDESKYSQYMNDVEDYHNNQPHLNNFFDKHEKLQVANPEAYAKRGQEKSAPIHEPLAEQPQEQQSSPVEQVQQQPQDKVDWSKVPQDIQDRLKKLGIIK